MVVKIEVSRLLPSNSHIWLQSSEEQRAPIVHGRLLTFQGRWVLNSQLSPVVVLKVWLLVFHDRVTNSVKADSVDLASVMSTAPSLQARVKLVKLFLFRSSQATGHHQINLGSSGGQVVK